MRNLNLYIFVIALFSFLITTPSCTDPCADVICANGGTCDDGDCKCPDGFSGTTCETQDLCFNANCNNGTCDTTTGNCNCEAGYEGADCSAEMRDKFEGNWTWTDNCNSGITNNSVISESPDNISKINISNILGDDLGGIAKADIDGNNISIAFQAVIDSNGETWTVSGDNTGILNSNSFEIKIIAVTLSDSFSCELTFNKQ